MTQQRQVAFDKLQNEQRLYIAGKYESGITDEQRRNIMLKLLQKYLG